MQFGPCTKQVNTFVCRSRGGEEGKTRTDYRQIGKKIEAEMDAALKRAAGGKNNGTR